MFNKIIKNYGFLIQVINFYWITILFSKVCLLYFSHDNISVKTVYISSDETRGFGVERTPEYEIRYEVERTSEFEREY